MRRFVTNFFRNIWRIPSQETVFLKCMIGELSITYTIALNICSKGGNFSLVLFVSFMKSVICVSVWNKHSNFDYFEYRKRHISVAWSSHRFLINYQNICCLYILSSKISWTFYLWCNCVETATKSFYFMELYYFSFFEFDKINLAGTKFTIYFLTQLMVIHQKQKLQVKWFTFILNFLSISFSAFCFFSISILCPEQKLVSFSKSTKTTTMHLSTHFSSVLFVCLKLKAASPLNSG